MGTRYTTGEDAAGIFAHPAPDDLCVAVTEFELREVTMHMPGTETVPVTTRGFDADQVLVIQASAPGGLHALVALARMRDARTGPMVQEPQSDAQESVKPQDEPAPSSLDRPLRRPLDSEECAAIRHAVHMAAPARVSSESVTHITGEVLAALRGMVDRKGTEA